MVDTDSEIIKALSQLQYGMYIVSSKDEEKINGQIATVVFQITCEPNQIATCLCKKNLTCDYLLKSRVFSISTLSQEADLKLIGHFGFRSGHDMDKFKDIPFQLGKTGAPLLLEKTTSALEATVTKRLDLNTHILFVGEIINGITFNEKPIMTYDYYHNVIKGKTHKNAPTFVQCKTVPKDSE